jgi:peptidoglycan/LPS O-acetylase OafA/YrhL
MHLRQWVFSGDESFSIVFDRTALIMAVVQFWDEPVSGRLLAIGVDGAPFANGLTRIASSTNPRPDLWGTTPVTAGSYVIAALGSSDSGSTWTAGTGAASGSIAIWVGDASYALQDGT